MARSHSLHTVRQSLPHRHLSCSLHSTYRSRIRRLPYISPHEIRNGLIQEPDRTLDRCRAEVHVALRGREILVPGQFLDGPRRGAPHRQVRAERVPEHMDPAVLDLSPTSCSSHPRQYGSSVQRLTVLVT